jgi:hypothetical protein
MNPSHIIGRLACILGAQSGAPLASIITAPPPWPPHDPGHPLEQARTCPAPRGLHTALISRACPGQIALIAARTVVAIVMPVLLAWGPAARQAPASPRLTGTWPSLAAFSGPQSQVAVRPCPSHRRLS